jgi:hypothetical protein
MGIDLKYPSIMILSLVPLLLLFYIGHSYTTYAQILQKAEDNNFSILKDPNLKSSKLYKGFLCQLQFPLLVIAIF